MAIGMKWCGGSFILYINNAGKCLERLGILDNLTEAAMIGKVQ